MKNHVSAPELYLLLLRVSLDGSYEAIEGKTWKPLCMYFKRDKHVSAVPYMIRLYHGALNLKLIKSSNG